MCYFLYPITSPLLRGECDGELKLEVKISADMCNMYRIGLLAICFISP